MSRDKIGHGLSRKEIVVEVYLHNNASFRCWRGIPDEAGAFHFGNSRGVTGV